MSNLGDVQTKLVGTTAQDLGGQATIDALFATEVVFDKAAADGAAGTATSNTKVWTNPYTTPRKILRAVIQGTSGLTADNTNYATVQLLTDDGAGGAPAVAASVITQVSAQGSWTANVSVAFANFVAAQLAVPAGGNIWMSITKAGSGVVVPISKITIILAKL
jgi:hypothetical protein